MIAMISCFAAGSSLWEKISEWYQGSLIRELINYFSEEYFSMELGTYDNFAISGSSGVALRNIILAVACGIILATLMTLYTRRGLGGFVRRLIAAEANSPESAKTLMELGYFRSVMIRRELAKGSSLRMVVRCPEQDAFESGAVSATNDTDAISAEVGVDGAGQGSAARRARPLVFRHDFLSSRFYIPEDLRARAEVRFDAKGSGWLPTLITVIATVIAAAAMCWFLPDLIQMADNLISFFSPS